MPARTLATVLITAIVCAICASSAAASFLSAPLPSGWSGQGSGIATYAEYSGGQWIWTDGLLDDKGAKTATSGNGKGDYTYPTDDSRFAASAADIAEIRAKRSSDGSRVELLARFNAMVVNDAAVIGFAFDTAAGGGAQAWGKNSKLSTTGTEHVLMLWGTGGQWDGGSLAAVGITTSIDLSTNTMTASVPAALLGSSPFGMYAASGLWNPSAQTWLEVAKTATATSPGGRPAAATAASNAFNVLRVGDVGTFQSTNQAVALATGTLPASQGAAVLKPTIDLDNGTGVTPLPTSGYLERTYYSAYAAGEGNSTAGLAIRGPRDNANGNPNGPYLLQNLGHELPYKIYVPSNLPAHPRIGVFMHGGGGNLNSFIDQPGIQQQFGEGLGMILVSCTGRGPNSGYTDASELDCLEALADAKLRYGLGDDTKALVMGHSMGASGTLRLAVTRPDLFNAAIAESPGPAGCDLAFPGCPPGYQAGTVPNGAPRARTANFRNLPFMDVHGEQDVNNPFADSVTLTNDLLGKGYMYRFMDEPTAAHSTLTDDDYWAEQAGFLQEVPDLSNPAHVTFSMSESWWRADISNELVFDHAYWLSGFHVRDTSNGFLSNGTVDATTSGLSSSVTGLSNINEDHSAATLPRPYQLTGQNYVFGTAETENRFSATLTNVSTSAFDLSKMGLRTDRPLSVHLVSDGGAQVLLKGSLAGTVVSGAPSTLAANGLTLSVSSGTTDVTIRPADSTPPSVQIDSPADGVSFLKGSSHAAHFTCADTGGSGLASCSGPVADGADLDTSSAGAKSFTVHAVDGDGNVKDQTVTYSVYADTTAPTVTIDAPVEGASFRKGTSQIADFSCADSGGSGLSVCAGPVADGDPLDTSSVGAKSFTVHAVDGAGNVTDQTVHYSVYEDTAAPTVQIDAPVDGASFLKGSTHPADYACADSGGSGLSSCSGPVADGDPVDTSSAGAKSFTVHATDGAGNVTDQTVNYTVYEDTSAPTVQVTSPLGAAYPRSSVHAAQYTCFDTGGSGLSACDGPVADGDALDTSTLGSHLFTVHADDGAGNTSETTVVYAVYAAPPVNVGPPAILGTPTMGKTLTVTLGTWRYGGNSSSYAIQWQRSFAGGAYTAVGTGKAYRLSRADVGARIRAIVTATNLDGSTSATATATAVVQGLPPVNSVSPSVTGSAVVGSVVTGKRGSWTGASPISYRYQWQRSDVAGTTFTDIPGSLATRAGYRVTSNDEGRRLRFVVTATNLDGTRSASVLTATVTS